MTRILVVKLLRDVRLQFLVVVLLTVAFQGLWCRVTQRITQDIVPALTEHVSFKDLSRIMFKGPGQLTQMLMGGAAIKFNNPLDVLSIGYIHPLMVTILCVWAVGRSAGAIAGEIDRGTMELLMAQPLARFRVILAHLCVDLLLIPVLCLSMWAGTWLGVWLVGGLDLQAPPPQNAAADTFGEDLMRKEPETPALQKILTVIKVLTENKRPEGASPVRERMRVNPMVMFPALWNVAALVFAVSGYTMALSAQGRFRGRVMGIAVLLTLMQFLVNVIAQIWDTVGFLRPFTVFFYYQPQQIAINHVWCVDLSQAWHLGKPVFVPVVPVLFLVGIAGYGLALWTFCRRDLPAPL